jgi:hypothetical protein
VGNASGYSPCSQREVDDIATLFPERTVLIGGEATPEAMKHLLKARNYDIVHLATGCLSLDVQAPLLSGIRFPIAGDENGIFRIDEFFGLTGSIDLLTLSIGLTIQPLRENQSDDDKITASSGEAFRSLTDEILASGAAATIIPLWHVNNFATGKLMEVMYQELIQGTAKDEALREAKQSLLRDPVYHNPYFWAQFVLYGDWSAMSSARPPDTGKLDYVLYQALQEWKSREHAPDEAPPFVSVVVTLAHPAIQEDLGRLRAISDEIEIQGAFGNFVQLRLPLSLLDAVCALSEVRSVATPTGTISN